MNRRQFLKKLGKGIIALPVLSCPIPILSCTDFYSPPRLNVDYWSGLEQDFNSFEAAKQAGHVPFTLGVGKRIDQPFDDLNPEEKQFIYDVNEAVKASIEELGLTQKEIKFYPIRDLLDRVPDCISFEEWIDVNTGPDPTFPEVGYQGLTLFGRGNKARVYVTSRDLYPDDIPIESYIEEYELPFPALMWEISNTFGYQEFSSGQTDLCGKIKENYYRIIEK